MFDESQSEILRKCAVFYLAVASDIVPVTVDLGKKMEAITQHRIKTELYPVIRKQEKFDLTAAQRRVKEYLSGLLTLTTDERQFLSSFRDKKYCPELLFDGEMLERVRNHPMAL